MSMGGFGSNQGYTSGNAGLANYRGNPLQRGNGFGTTSGYGADMSNRQYQTRPMQMGGTGSQYQTRPMPMNTPDPGFGPQPPVGLQNPGFSVNPWTSPSMGQGMGSTANSGNWNGVDNLTLSGQGSRTFTYDPATMGNSTAFQWGSVGTPTAQTQGLQSSVNFTDANGNVVGNGSGAGRIGAMTGLSGLVPGQTYTMNYNLPGQGQWNLIGNARNNQPAAAPSGGVAGLMDILRRRQGM